jgi:hypothetical protein
LRLHPLQRLRGVYLQAGQPLGYHVPDDCEIDLIVGMAQAVTHPPNILPGLSGHQHRCAVTQSVGIFADAFEASLDGIATETVLLQRGQVEVGGISLDARDVIENVCQTIRDPVPPRTP